MVKKDYLKIIGAVIILVALGFVTLKFWQSERLRTTTIPQPFKFSENKDVDSVMQRVIKFDQAKKQAVPADNDKFSVNYYGDAKNFTVIIKVKPFDEVKAEAVNWFKDQGFKEADFCSLKVTFLAVAGVKDNFEPKDAVFNGCPVPNAPVKVTPPPGQVLKPISPSK